MGNILSTSCCPVRSPSQDIQVNRKGSDSARPVNLQGTSSSTRTFSAKNDRNDVIELRGDKLGTHLRLSKKHHMTSLFLGRSGPLVPRTREPFTTEMSRVSDIRSEERSAHNSPDRDVFEVGAVSHCNRHGTHPSLCNDLSKKDIFLKGHTKMAVVLAPQKHEPCTPERSRAPDIRSEERSAHSPPEIGKSVAYFSHDDSHRTPIKTVSSTQDPMPKETIGDKETPPPTQNIQMRERGGADRVRLSSMEDVNVHSNISIQPVSASEVDDSKAPSSLRNKGAMITIISGALLATFGAIVALTSSRTGAVQEGELPPEPSAPMEPNFESIETDVKNQWLDDNNSNGELVQLGANGKPVTDEKGEILLTTEGERQLNEAITDAKTIANATYEAAMNAHLNKEGSEWDKWRDEVKERQADQSAEKHHSISQFAVGVGLATVGGAIGGYGIRAALKSNNPPSIPTQTHVK